MREIRDEVAAGGRRLSDDIRYWVPIVLSLVTTMLVLGGLYGKLDGRLNLIEYRLMNIEKQVTPAATR